LSSVHLKEVNSLIQQGCIKLIKCDSKDIYNVTKDYISNKSCPFPLLILQRTLKICITVSKKILNLYMSASLSTYLLTSSSLADAEQQRQYKHTWYSAGVCKKLRVMCYMWWHDCIASVCTFI